MLVPDHSDWPEDITVERLAPGRIVLSRSQDTERPGVYGLVWQAGHALVGPVIRIGDDTVTRRLRQVRGYLPPGEEVAIDPRVYSGDPGEALGLPFADVRIPGELGPLPAWSIPGRSDTWAIVVHGINSDPQTGLRIAPTLHRAGLPTLLITYREDLGAPASPDGFHHMGLTEWRDLEAAARYALSFNATQMGFPSFSTLPVEWAIGTRIDVDWDSLDAVKHPEAFQLPILLFHGGEDDLVPISTSEKFAAELPRWVTFHRYPRAGHCEAWNVDPPLYEGQVTSFLTSLG